MRAGSVVAQSGLGIGSCSGSVRARHRQWLVQAVEVRTGAAVAVATGAGNGGGSGRRQHRL